VICVTVIVTVNTYHKPHNRAWRLFGVPWFYSGTATAYSAFRGYDPGTGFCPFCPCTDTVRFRFCSMLAVRGSLQLRAWELDEPADEEAKIALTATPRRDSRSTHPSQSTEENSLDDANYDKAPPTLNEIPTLAPFAAAAAAAAASEEKAKIVAPFVEPDRSSIVVGTTDAGVVSNPDGMAAIAPFVSEGGKGAPFSEPLDEDRLSATIGKASSEAVPNTDAIAPSSTTTSYQKARMVAPFLEPLGDPSEIHAPIPDDPPAGKALIRPKTFGPERVVEDPRVKAALLRYIWEMHLFAFYGSIVSPS
jgi:hypothetical protein